MTTLLDCRMFRNNSSKSLQNYRIGRVKLKINIDFLNQDSLSSTNDHLSDFDDTDDDNTDFEITCVFR